VRHIDLAGPAVALCSLESYQVGEWYKSMQRSTTLWIMSMSRNLDQTSPALTVGEANASRPSGDSLAWASEPPLGDKPAPRPMTPACPICGRAVTVSSVVLVMLFLSIDDSWVLLRRDQYLLTLASSSSLFPRHASIKLLRTPTLARDVLYSILS
jgi:hypothetical protein